MLVILLQCFFCFCRSDFHVNAGFGSVFDGTEDFVALANMSTQAVLSYIKNINDVSERRDQAEFVAIGAQEVEALHIDRPEIDGNSIATHGKLF